MSKAFLTLFSVNGRLYGLHLKSFWVDAAVDVHDVSAKFGIDILSEEAVLEGVVREVANHPDGLCCKEGDSIAYSELFVLAPSTYMLIESP